MAWVKLEVGNNWGAIFYTYPGERLNAGGTNETRNALELSEGLLTAVRFPDGWARVVALAARVENFRGSDMGHEYMGQTRRWGFDFEVHGLQVWIPLESVEVVHDFALRHWQRLEALEAAAIESPAPGGPVV